MLPPPSAGSVSATEPESPAPPLRPSKTPAIAAGRSAAWAIAEYFGYPLLMFAATPLFLHLLGATVYGQWMLLLTLNGLGGLAGMGMGTAATREVAGHLGRDDRIGAAAATRSCLGVTLAASGAIAALIVLGVLLAPTAWLARMGDPAAIHVIALAGAAMIALEQIDTVFAGAIRGAERYDISAKIELTFRLTVVVTTVVAAALTRSLFAIVVVTLILMIARSTVKAGLATRLLNATMLWPGWDRHHVSVAFGFGKWTWAQAIGAALFATADRLLVGGMMGAVALAHYSICVQLAQQVQTLPAAGAQVLLPRVSRLESQGLPYRAMAIRVMLAVIALAGMFALGLALLGGWIMRLWVGPTIAGEMATTLPLLALGYAVLGANVVPHYVLLGVGRARFVALLNIAAGIVAIIVAWFLIPSWGFIGAALGRLCYAIVTSANIPALLRQSRDSASPDMTRHITT